MTNDVGSLGEDLVASWLQTRVWSVLHRRWYCRWGELDLVAQQSLTQSLDTTEHKTEATLAFIEVKTRSQGNWDEDGLLAVTPQKQAKIVRAAQFFLAQHPVLADSPCRFDVALVYCKKLPILHRAGADSFGNKPLQLQMPVLVNIGEPVKLTNYQLTLQRYFEAAF